MNKKSYKKTVLFLGLISIGSYLNLADAKDNSKSKIFSPNVDAKGNIQLPKDFRRTMVHLGTWFVPEGGASGFHDVYAEASAVDGYRRTGKWPDGATIVKELRDQQTGSYTTGNVSHASEVIKQWFVMVKDTQGRFSNNSSWGDGWGWALIKPENKKNNISVNYKADCLGCHVPAKGTDWIYVEGMPTLTSKK